MRMLCVLCLQVNYYRNGEDRRMSKRQTVYGQNVGTAMVYGLLPNTFYVEVSNLCTYGQCYSSLSILSLRSCKVAFLGQNVHKLRIFLLYIKKGCSQLSYPQSLPPSFVCAAVPFFTLPLSDQFVEIGGDVDLRCEALGKPLPSYRWFRDGVELRFPTRDQTGTTGVDFTRYQLSTAGNRLKITKLLSEDSHTFQCSAFNSLGTVYTTANLKVLGMFCFILLHEFYGFKCM